MGRYHVLKPHHLYLTPPTHSSSPIYTLRSSYTSPSALLQSSSISALSVGGRIPGFKISAAFLSSLHSNIFIELDSTYDSPLSTPSGPHSSSIEGSSSYIPSSMSSLTDSDLAPPDSLRPQTAAPVTNVSDGVKSRPPTADENGVPLLSTFSAEDEDTRAEGLHIIADSVAQQRNAASRALIFHPLSMAAFVVLVALLKQFFYDSATTDWIKVGMTMTGVVMALLGAVRLACGPYIFEAERVGTWKWLNQGRSAEEEEQTSVRVLGEQDEMLVTKFGDEYIGCIIFRGVQPIAPNSSNGSKKTRRTPSASKQTRTVIRAWSVGQKYRKKEVGSALIEDALKLAQSKGWTTEGVEFAADHANHKRILPTVFNGPLDKFVTIAQQTLDKKTQELGLVQDKSKKRK